MDVEFAFTLQRKPLYYVHNLIVPCIIQMIIILFTFFLPPESGERIGKECFLAYYYDNTFNAGIGMLWYQVVEGMPICQYASLTHSYCIGT